MLAFLLLGGLWGLALTGFPYTITPRTGSLAGRRGSGVLRHYRRCGFFRVGAMPATVYRLAEGEAHIGALYDEALATLGTDYESLTVGTRLGDTHVLAVGPEGAPPALFGAASLTAGLLVLGICLVRGRHEGAR